MPKFPVKPSLRYGTFSIFQDGGRPPSWICKSGKFYLPSCFGGPNFTQIAGKNTPKGKIARPPPIWSKYRRNGLRAMLSVNIKKYTQTSNVAENLGKKLFLYGTYILGERLELILTVNTETRPPIEGPFGNEFPAICNHCWVMMAWSRKTRKFCEQFLRNDPSQTFATARIVPKIHQSSPLPPHLAHIVPDFIQIGSLSAELLPNAWKPFLPRRV